MKKISIILVMLFWCNVSFAKELKIYHKDENTIRIQFSMLYTRQAKIAAQHCAQYQKFAYKFFGESDKGLLYHCSSKKLTKSPISGSKIYWTNYDPNHDFAITYKPKTIYNGPRNIEDAKKLFGDRKLDLIEGIWSSSSGIIYVIIKKNDMEYIRWTVDHYEKRFIGQRDASVKIIKSANPNVYAYHFDTYSVENPSITALSRTTIIIKNFNMFEYTIPGGCWSEERCWSASEGYFYRLWPASSTEIASPEKPKDKFTPSSGTAFFVTQKGHVITNFHVVKGCKDKSKIVYQDNEIKAKLLAKDKHLDLALLKADVKNKHFIKISNKSPKKLQRIIAAGYPFGKELSDDLKFTSGIVSSLKGLQDDSTRIQIDAALNYGNSGGPIVDEKTGELVAVAVSGLTKEITESINFGIKAGSVKNFLDSNQINTSLAASNFSWSSVGLSAILENATVYTFCK
jgi:S1-C subfamily serine protease